MKLITLTLVIAFDDDEEDRPAPVPTPPENPLDALLKRLLLEASRGRTPKIPEEKPHGTFFTV